MFGGYQSLTKVRLSSNVLWITYSTLMISVFSTSCLYLIFKMPSCVNTTLMSKSFPLSTTLKPIYIRTTQWSIWNGCRRIKCRLTRATCLKNSIRSSATNDVNKITFLEREYVGRSREFRFCCRRDSDMGLKFQSDCIIGAPFSDKPTHIHTRKEISFKWYIKV